MKELYSLGTRLSLPRVMLPEAESSPTSSEPRGSSALRGLPSSFLVPHDPGLVHPRGCVNHPMCLPDCGCTTVPGPGAAVMRYTRLPSPLKLRGKTKQNENTQNKNHALGPSAQPTLHLPWQNAADARLQVRATSSRWGGAPLSLLLPVPTCTAERVLLSLDEWLHSWFNGQSPGLGTQEMWVTH